MLDLLQVAELKAELEACKNNSGKDVILKSVKSESETEVEANEPSQTVQSESGSEEMSKKVGKYNFSTCSEVSTDQIGDVATPQEQASHSVSVGGGGGGIDGDNASSLQDVSTPCYINFTENNNGHLMMPHFGHLMKYGEPDGSYYSFTMDHEFRGVDYSDSLWE